MFNIKDLEMRTIQKKDMESIIDFGRRLNASDKLEISINEDQFSYLLDTPEFKENFYVVYHENNLIALSNFFKFGEKAEEAQVQVIVDAELRRKGIGNQLYKELMNKISETDVKKIKAIVKKDNEDAVSFAKKNGFITESYMWKMDLNSSNIEFSNIDMEGLTYREATKEDIEAFTDIMNEGFRENKDKYTTKDMENSFVSPSINIFIIEKDDYPVAGAVVNLQDDISIGYISHVAVRKNNRGQGIGKKLLQICVNKIKEEKMAKASLHVDGVNENALNLYKKVGFEVKETYITFEKEL